MIDPIYKGQNFHKINKSGKWIQVESSNGKEKGWVAGWHTNLDIQADANPNAKPLKDKTIVLDLVNWINHWINCARSSS